ncbi:hypothetical protein AVEN_247455-1 [Araneus ventricosus]|uniref:Uncharacterized protein n=1 Tax=Araneus ventricosus TaxID=182803 RepID=A0A4Y2P958_ARAVE|nr:hypothetical protein AVEN_247455-1 [Araneus ventricosus]
MQKGTKSFLYKAFKPCTRDLNAESNVYIIDGGVAHQHSLNVYYHIQHWLGHKKRLEDWGCERTNSGLQSVKTLKTPHLTLSCMQDILQV